MLHESKSQSSPSSQELSLLEEEDQEGEASMSMIDNEQPVKMISSIAPSKDKNKDEPTV